MRFYIGVTDNDWYHYLASIKPQEVNFWKPTARTGFRILEAGEPFLFKLHSPENFIVGGGFFVEYTSLPLSMAWEVFGKENGASDFSSFRALIGAHMEKGGLDPQIGCIVLNEPFFFDREDWLPIKLPAGVRPGMKFSTDEKLGRDLWAMVERRILALPRAVAAHLQAGRIEIPEGYGTPYLTSGRLGQKAFSALLLDLYHRRCAITGEKTMPVLQAAHIRPFSEQGPNKPQNGLLLRADVHILFDKGYITVTPDLHVEVSNRIKEEYENGRDYYKYHGEPLVNVPGSELIRPSKEYLEWHNSNKYEKRNG